MYWSDWRLVRLFFFVKSIDIIYILYFLITILRWFPKERNTLSIYLDFFSVVILRNLSKIFLKIFLYLVYLNSKFKSASLTFYRFYWYSSTEFGCNLLRNVQPKSNSFIVKLFSIIYITERSEELIQLSIWYTNSCVNNFNIEIQIRIVFNIFLIF